MLSCFDICCYCVTLLCVIIRLHATVCILLLYTVLCCVWYAVLCCVVLHCVMAMRGVIHMVVLYIRYIAVCYGTVVCIIVYERCVCVLRRVSMCCIGVCVDMLCYAVVYYYVVLCRIVVVCCVVSFLVGCCGSLRCRYVVLRVVLRASPVV